MHVRIVCLAKMNKNTPCLPSILMQQTQFSYLYCVHLHPSYNTLPSTMAILCICMIATIHNVPQCLLCTCTCTCQLLSKHVYYVYCVFTQIHKYSLCLLNIANKNNTYSTMYCVHS